MSKPTKEHNAQERAALLTIAEAVLEDYFSESPSFLSAEARKEWAQLQAYMVRRKQALLAPPAPKQARPKQAAASGQANEEAEREYQAVARYEPDTSNLRRAGKDGRGK